MKEMPDILQRICDAKRREIDRLHKAGELTLSQMVRAQEAPRPFREALAADRGVALIAEIKKASPSAGVIREDFDAEDIASGYEKGGARCLSVLTDKPFFHGSLEHLMEARSVVSLPVLRKDFILDKAQIIESRAWGADCVLLIAAVLDPGRLGALLAKAWALDMDALVEVHDEDELQVALAAGADLIGINNRDLHTFEVDLGVACRLAPLVPKNVLVVAESGIKSRADVERLKACGVRAVLVGETLMRAEDIVAATRALSSA